MSRYFVVLVLFVLISSICLAACPYQLEGDVNADCKVDLSDIASVAGNWLVDCNIDPTNSECDAIQSVVEQQKDQFRYIKDALELYRAEFGEYPPSYENYPNANYSYSGANKLAEALVGLDRLGVHPNTDFRADGFASDGDGFEYPVYHADRDEWIGPNLETALENVQSRKGPFIDAGVANVFALEDIYPDLPGNFIVSNGDPYILPSLALCDVFEKTRSSGKATGMPILYYRARDYFYEQDLQSGLGFEDDIYCYNDNWTLLEISSPVTPMHPLADGNNDLEEFENMILDPAVTVIKRPYRPDGYILISAGFDGLYGTADDQFDFELLKDEPLPVDVPQEKEVEQRAQLRAIEIALEIYSYDFDGYPPSNDNQDRYDDANNDPYDPTPYGGANKLAEVVVGLDMLGVHPNTTFRSDGMRFDASEDYPVYHANFDIPGETAAQNIDARIEPWLDLQQANVFTMQDVYGEVGPFRDSASPPSQISKSLVLCDVFERKRSSGKSTGMPILYYKARSVYYDQDFQSPNGIADDIYYYPDNQNLLELGARFEAGYDYFAMQPLADGQNDFEEFEQMILNPIFTTFKMPYNRNSFVLISAGKDGLYGTADDITNFDQ